MALYTQIDQDTCISCGACSAEAPDVYGELSSGIAYNRLDDNAGTADVSEYEEDIDYALDGCPTESILVQDSPLS